MHVEVRILLELPILTIFNSNVSKHTEKAKSPIAENQNSSKFTITRGNLA